MHLGLGLGFPTIAPPIFKPTTVSNCVLWLDGADVSTQSPSSGQFSQWSDKAGGGAWTQTTSADKFATGTRTLNNHNAPVGNANSFMNAPSSFYTLPSGDFTIFFVIAYDSLSNSPVILNGGSSTSNGILIWEDNAGANLHVLCGGGQAVGISHTIATGVPHLYRVYKTESSGESPLFSIDLDGVFQVSVAATNFSFSSAVLGNFPNSTNGVTGLIPQVIAYNRALTAAENNYIGNGFKAEFGSTWVNQ